MTSAEKTQYLKELLEGIQASAIRALIKRGPNEDLDRSAFQRIAQYADDALKLWPKQKALSDDLPS